MINLPFHRFPSYGKEEPHYTYACGRIRALESTLLDRVRVQRLKELKTAGEVFRNLQDTYYSRFLQNIEKPEEFINIIPSVREETLGVVIELLEPEYGKELLTEYDFRNLKSALKVFVGELDKKAARPYTAGNIPFSLMLEAIKEDKLHFLPQPLREAAERAVEAYYEKHEIRKIDTAIDKYFYGNVVLSYRSEFLKNYYRIKADFTNILTFLRLKMLDRVEYLSDYLLSGGFIPADFYKKLVEVQELAREIESTPYYPYLRDGFASYEREKDVLLLEKGYDNYLSFYVRTTKFVDMGHEPVMAFYLARMHELKILKIIITAKLTGVEEEVISRRIPEVML